MAASTLSPRAEMVLRRHVPPAQLRLLKISTFDLMTRPELIGQAPTEPNQSTNRPDARRVGKFVESLRSAVRPKIADAPTWGRDTSWGRCRGPAPSRCRARNPLRRRGRRQPGRLLRRTAKCCPRHLDQSSPFPHRDPSVGSTLWVSQLMTPTLTPSTVPADLNNPLADMVLALVNLDDP